MLYNFKTNPLELMNELHIDPALLNIPQNPAASASIPSCSGASTIDLTNKSTDEVTAAQSPSVIGTVLELKLKYFEPKHILISKQKSSHIEGFEPQPMEPEIRLKRLRVDTCPSGLPQMVSVFLQHQNLLRSKFYHIGHART